MWRRYSILGLAALLPLGAACQSILGFEDFEGDSGGSAGNPPATGAEGDACDTAEDCRGTLTCIYGRCRVSCGDETDCPSESLCLFSGTSGGCRLSSEGACDAGRCENAQLVCGLDDTCRVACGDANSCDSPTQVCIRGACVSTVGEDVDRFDCGDRLEGDVACDGATLAVCNVLEPGMATIETCSSAGVCESSVPATGKYDESSPPICQDGCSPGTRYCEGASLRECKQDGSGPVDSGIGCATAALCQEAAIDGSATCPEPHCEAGETRCAGGQTSLRGETCNDGRTQFEPSDLCDVADLQCNPATAQCISILLDATEVSNADYAAWLAGAPSTADQPPGCVWNDTFEKDPTCAGEETCSGDADDCPVVCVDWCDARAYCVAQGLRLCGRIGGGMVPFEEYADPGKSEWMNGCTAGGQFSYGHGNEVPETDPTACPYAGNSGGTAYAVGSRSVCRSPGRGYSTLRDLSGNVAEWEDSCERAATDATAGAADACRTRGGSYRSSDEQVRCASVPTVPLRRNDTDPTVGFRCCAD